MAEKQLQRLPMIELAKALGKNRKTLQRWRKAGAPFAEDGSGVLREIAAWAQAQGLLERNQEDGRRPEVERMAAAVIEESPAAATVPASKAAKAVERIAAALSSEPSGPTAASELSDLDKEALELLVNGDASALIRLAATVDPKLLKKAAFMGKTRRELAEAERRELENKARRRELVPLEEVKRFWAGQIAIVKSHFLALPGKLTPRLVRQDYDVIFAELEREHYALLEAFSREIPS